MKKLKLGLSVFLSSALCMSTFGGVGTVSATSTTYLQGDIDDNGSVDLLDVSNLAIFLSGSAGSANDSMSQRLDVDSNTVIDNNDLDLLRLIVLGDESSSTKSYASSSSVPSQNTIAYQEYNAQSGEAIGDDYVLYPVNSIGGTAPRNIFGADTRQIDYSKSGVVKLTTTYPRGSSECTGFVVDEHTILTAAHCVYDMESESPINNLKYTLYNSNGTEVATYNAVSYHLPVAYTDVTNYYTETYDYALITVSQDLSDYMCFDVGVATDRIINSSNLIYATGFSGSRESANGNSSINTSLYGHMVTSVGYLSRSLAEDRIFYDTDTVGGQSGCPIYISNSDGRMTVIGICTSNYDEYNVAARIDTDMLHFIYNNPNI